MYVYVLVIHTYNGGSARAQVQVVITVQSRKLCRCRPPEDYIVGLDKRGCKCCWVLSSFNEQTGLPQELAAWGTHRHQLQVSVSISGYWDITKHQCNAEELGSYIVQGLGSILNQILEQPEIWINLIFRSMKRYEHFRSERSGHFASQFRTWRWVILRIYSIEMMHFVLQ